MNKEEQSEILFPDLPIIDAHHHVADRVAGPLRLFYGRDRHMAEDHAHEMASSGHKFVATVLVETHAMYRPDGAEAFRSVLETEVMNGQAALSDTGIYGPVRIGAAIVCSADLRLGDLLRSVLEAHLAAAPRRLRGVRYAGVWDPDPTMLPGLAGEGPNMYGFGSFRAGMRVLASLGLSFDAFILSTQIPDVTELARAFPGVSIILNHLGNPVGLGPYAGRQDEIFARWRTDITALAKQQNVAVKLGGLGTPLSGFASISGTTPASEDALVADWRPYIETAIELFGAHRCMFEGNYPVEHLAGSYRSIWNAFKVLTKNCSADERAALFSGTAACVYRIDDPAR